MHTGELVYVESQIICYYQWSLDKSTWKSQMNPDENLDECRQKSKYILYHNVVAQEI